MSCIGVCLHTTTQTTHLINSSSLWSDLSTHSQVYKSEVRARYAAMCIKARLYNVLYLVSSLWSELSM